jgi:hypothetical protein
MQSEVALTDNLDESTEGPIAGPTAPELQQGDIMLHRKKNNVKTGPTRTLSKGWMVNMTPRVCMSHG